MPQLADESVPETYLKLDLQLLKREAFSIH